MSHYISDLLTLKSFIKEIIDNLVIDIDNLKFLSVSTIQEENIVVIVVATSLRMTPTEKQNSVKFHWFRKHTGKEYVIGKIESENQKADIFT